MKEFNVIKEMLPKLGSLDFNIIDTFIQAVDKIVNKYKNTLFEDRFENFNVKVIGFAGVKTNEYQELELVFIFSISRYINLFGYFKTYFDYVSIPLKYLYDENLLKTKIKNIDELVTTTDVFEGFSDTIEDAKRALYEEMNKEED